MLMSAIRILLVNLLGAALLAISPAQISADQA